MRFATSELVVVMAGILMLIKVVIPLLSAAMLQVELFVGWSKSEHYPRKLLLLT
jgi:hypothetical protein